MLETYSFDVENIGEQMYYFRRSSLISKSITSSSFLLTVETLILLSIISILNLARSRAISEGSTSV